MQNPRFKSPTVSCQISLHLTNHFISVMIIISANHHGQINSEQAAQLLEAENEEAVIVTFHLFYTYGGQDMSFPSLCYVSQASLPRREQGDYW